VPFFFAGTQALPQQEQVNMHADLQTMESQA
jgi:hypothetical protein